MGISYETLSFFKNNKLSRFDKSVLERLCQSLDCRSEAPETAQKGQEMTCPNYTPKIVIDIPNGRGIGVPPVLRVKDPDKRDAYPTGGKAEIQK